MASTSISFIGWSRAYMLTESTYLLGLYLYLGAAGILVLYTAWWSWRSWRPFWAALVVLIMAAL